MPEESPDRYHNREHDSPESLRRSVDALAEAVASLDRRLDDATLRLGGEIDGARTTTRQLATEVGRMGEALVRRIEAERVSPPQAASRLSRTWLLALALTAGLILAIAGVVAFPR